MYKEDIDYKFIDIPDTDLTAIQLLIDKYDNVVYHYHKARIHEEGGIARLQFAYTILDSGSYDIDDLNTSQEFHTIMGDILTILLMSKAKDDESFRNNNTKEFDLQ